MSYGDKERRSEPPTVVVIKSVLQLECLKT